MTPPILGAFIDWGQLASHIVTNSLSTIGTLIIVTGMFKAFEKRLGRWWDRWAKERREHREDA